MIVDTPGGRIYVQWDTDVSATPNGQPAFFADFLHAAGLYEAWVQDRPLHYASPNAPTKYDVLGTLPEVSPQIHVPWQAFQAC